MIKKIASVLISALMFFGLSTTAEDLIINKEPKAKIQYFGAYYSLSQIEFTEICSVVMAESGGEPFKGQQAVAQTILNTCRITGLRPLEVIREYSYTSWRPTPSESAKKAVLSVFTDGVEVIDERVTMFYAPKRIKGGYSADHESQVYSCTIGGHRFFIENANIDKFD